MARSAKKGAEPSRFRRAQCPAPQRGLQPEESSYTGSETVATGSATTYHNQTAGSSSDLAAGQTVQVQTSGGSSAAPNASASPGTQTTRTATDVTITSN